MTVDDRGFSYDNLSMRRSSNQINQSPKYDMRVNPVYQIDWQNSASGKRVSATKRRVRWRFGFSNAQALQEGLTGTECRGEEHEVTLIWSLTSGKRVVVADGEEVHFSTGKISDGKFETSWTMKGNHVLKLIAHAAPPLRAMPGFRQFDLQLDGFSFFDMPRIFELGVRKLAGPPPPPQAFHRLPHSNNYDSEVNHYTRSVDTLPDYEQNAPPPCERRHSMPVLPKSSVQVSQAGDRTPSLTPVSFSSSSTSLDLMSDPGFAEPKDLFASPPLPSIVAHDEFAPKPVPPPPPPTFDATAHQILQAYGPALAVAPGVLALPNESHTYGVPTPPPPGGAPPQYQNNYYQQPPVAPQPYAGGYHQPYPPAVYQPTPPPTYASQPPQIYNATPAEYQEHTSEPVSNNNMISLTPTMMKPLNLVEEELKAQPYMSELERAMKALVNLDDITETVTTPEQVKTQERKVSKEPLKSKPLPPTTPEWHLGPQAKLADIKEHKPVKEAPSKEVMRTHAFDPAAVHAGMMVVYGQAPPSLPTISGFGAGANRMACTMAPPQMMPPPYAPGAPGYHPSYAHAMGPAPVTMAQHSFAAY